MNWQSLANTWNITMVSDHYKIYKLTITRYKSRLALAKAIRYFAPDLPFALIPKIVDNLEKEPFIVEQCAEKPDLIAKLLDDVAFYSYEEIFIEPDYSCVPPWERIEYKQAKSWYDTLPEEDRKRIDILVSGNVPWG